MPLNFNWEIPSYQLKTLRIYICFSFCAHQTNLYNIIRNDPLNSVCILQFCGVVNTTSDEELVPPAPCSEGLVCKSDVRGNLNISVCVFEVSYQTQMVSYIYTVRRRLSEQATDENVFGL